MKLLEQRASLNRNRKSVCLLGHIPVSSDSQLMSKGSWPELNPDSCCCSSLLLQSITLDKSHHSTVEHKLWPVLCKLSHVLALQRRALGCHPDCPCQTPLLRAVTATPNRPPTDPTRTRTITWIVHTYVHTYKLLQRTLKKNATLQH